MPDIKPKKTKKKPPAKPKTRAKKVTPPPEKPASKGINCQLPGWEEVKAGKSVKEVSEKAEKELKPEQDRFCREYIRDGNGTRSYLRSHPNCGYNTARTEAAKLLAIPSVKRRVSELREARNKRLELSADKVLKRLEARASVNLADLYDDYGQLIPIHEMDPDVAIGIKSIEVVELFDGKGEQRQAVGLVRKITLHDGRASDELLGRNFQLWKDVGSKENPLNAEVDITEYTPIQRAARISHLLKTAKARAATGEKPK